MAIDHCGLVMSYRFATENSSWEQQPSTRNRSKKHVTQSAPNDHLLRSFNSHLQQQSRSSDILLHSLNQMQSSGTKLLKNWLPLSTARWVLHAVGALVSFQAVASAQEPLETAWYQMCPYSHAIWGFCIIYCPSTAHAARYMKGREPKFYMCSRASMKQPKRNKKTGTRQQRSMDVQAPNLNTALYQPKRKKINFHYLPYL